VHQMDMTTLQCEEGDQVRKKDYWRGDYAGMTCELAAADWSMNLDDGRLRGCGHSLRMS
jgi:hypothetical protein